MFFRNAAKLHQNARGHMPRNCPFIQRRENFLILHNFQLLIWVSITEWKPQYLHFGQCKQNINYRLDFYLLLSVHLDVILVNGQLDALFLNVFISCLYMFRAQLLIIRRAKLY
jgi:hypothetical protein